MRSQPRLRTAAAVVALIAGSFALALWGQWGQAGAVSGGGATISVQTMDSCHQIKGQAAYALTGGGVSMSASTPAGSGTASGTGCPVPTGSCSAGPCAVFSGVPDGTYRIVTTRTPPPSPSNPEGYAPCEGGSACRSQVADLTVSGGSVSATVTNVYPDGTTTQFHFSGSSGDPIVFHDFGLAAPGSSSNSQCDGDSDADDHLTGSPSGHCAYPEAQESSACQPFPWSCTMGASAAPPPAVRRLTVSMPATVDAFSATPVTVSAMNGTAVDPTFTGTVTLTDPADRLAEMPPAYTFTSADRGVHVFTVTFRHTGAMTVTASVKGRSSGATGGSDPITVANDDASFVEDLYHDILGRLGADSEVAYWAGRLASGMPREAVAAFFSTSPEVDARDVDAAYQLMIGHPADPAGRAFWISQLEAGNFDEALLAGLAATPNYYAGHGGGTDRGFITALYRDLLGRAPSPAELNAWLAQGPITDRAGIAGDFAFSHEHHHDLVAAPTTGWYAHYLGRPADGAGAEYWASRLDQGVRDEVGVAAFTGCDEYYGKPVTY